MERMRQYFPKMFQAKDDEKMKIVNENNHDHKETSKLSVSERLRENVGGKFKEMKTYFRPKHQPDNGEKVMENGATHSSNIHSHKQSASSETHSVGHNDISQQLDIIKNDKQIKPSMREAPEVKGICEYNDEIEEAFEDALDSHRETAMIDSVMVTKARTEWGTRYFSENGSKATWKVSRVLATSITKTSELPWKVALKLRPARKIIIIQFDHQDNKSSIEKSDESSTIKKYKIVLVGDSGVGKTSFIRRCCKDTFKSSFHSTVGVDYQEKEVVMNRKRLVLQFWDTAGQERFRSMCVQYYRNADAVIIIYDVTSEESFKNIRRWMDSIEENTTDDRVFMVIGNKIDAINLKLNNGIKTAHGELIAKEYAALFFETSVKHDENVKEAITALVKLLQNKVYPQREQITLEEKSGKKRKWC